MIEAIHQASALVGGTDVTPPSDVAMARGVGVALAMAVNLSGFNDVDFDNITKTELINKINGMDKVYQLISATNEEVMICTDTAVRCFTRALVARVQMAKGVVAGLSNGDLFDATTVSIATILVPGYKAAL